MNHRTVADVAKAYLDDLLRHDWESAIGQLADDAQIVVAGRNTLAGTFVSPARFLEVQQWIFLEHDAGIDVMRCDELLTGERIAVAIVLERVHRDVRWMRYKRLHLMTIESGKIVELKMIAEDLYALDQFWE